MMMSRDFIQRVTASNGSVFTGPGTNSFLIGRNDITLVDPGPKIDAHIENLVKLGEGKIKRILVTHTHRDHSPAAKVLGEMLGVPLMGRLLEKDDSMQDKTFKPDRILEHGDLIETDEYTIETIHTPGHASNHLCYLIQEEKINEINWLPEWGKSRIEGSVEEAKKDEKVIESYLGRGSKLKDTS